MTYPTRNPFPTQATVTIEGRMTYSVLGVPTAERESMRRLMSLAERYLRDDPAHRVGRAVTLRGEHGAGKTHALLYALAEMTRHRGLDVVDQERGKLPLALYVRADGPDPVALYRKLMSQLTLGDLRELAMEAFAGYAAEAFSDTRSAAPADAERVSEQLRSNPELALQAVTDKQLSWTAVIDRQEADLEEIQRLGWFDRAVRALLEPTLAELAHLWLRGGELDDQKLASLGVQANIRLPDEARIGVHVLAALASVARRPLVLVVDQAESLLIGSDGRLDRQGTGWLRDIVEALPGERGFLVVAMSQFAWTTIPFDLQMRFGQSVIDVPGLTPDDARAVLNAYLEPWAPEPPTFPFEPDGVRRLLTATGGNPRRFLQMAHEAFTAAAPTRVVIDHALVDRVATASTEPPPTKDEVRRVIERVLERKRLVFETTQPALSGQVIDYAILRGSEPMVYIEISNAVFARDEAQAAIENVGKIRAAREGHVPIVLIVIGYSSPEVTDALKQVVTSIVVAQDARFEASLDDALSAIMTGGSPEQLESISGELAALKGDLARLADQREREEQLVADRLLMVTERMSETRRADELRLYKQLWGSENDRIRADIKRRREELWQADFVGAIDGHWLACRDAQHRRRMVTVGAGLALLVAAFGLQHPAVLLVIGLTAVAVVAVNILLTLRLDAERVATGRLRSVDELQHYIHERYSRRASLRSRDPFRRYAAARTSPPLDVLRAAEAEPRPLMRRLLVSSVLAGGGDAVELTLRSALDDATRSLAVECAEYTFELTAPLPDQLKLVQAIKARDWESHVSELLPGPLAQVFGDQDVERLVSAVAKVTERDLRRAIAALSPFEENGLGTWYWLKNIARVDELFLFLRHATFIAAGGWSPAPGAVSPASPGGSG